MNPNEQMHMIVHAIQAIEMAGNPRLASLDGGYSRGGAYGARIARGDRSDPGSRGANEVIPDDAA